MSRLFACCLAVLALLMMSAAVATAADKEKVKGKKKVKDAAAAESPADPKDPPAETPADEGEGWVTIWDGKTFDGWKASENKDSWKIEDGALVAHGERSHLFYVGDDKPFTNFELKVDVMTKENSNGGIYFHTKYQEDGWPTAGYEAQVNNSHKDPKRTGSLYNVRNVLEPPAKDDEWFTEHIKVDGKHITIQVNGKTVVDYEEDAGDFDDKKMPERKLSSGTFALQAHDPGSTVYFKNIRVRRLP